MRQIGALPYRAGAGGTEVLLITSRDTGRWVVPKGNPIRGLAPHEAAAQEAWEEAGVRGRVSAVALGDFSYVKRRRRGDVDALVMLYPLSVTVAAGDWPERSQRQRAWFAPAAAARIVTEPQLKRLIGDFSAPAESSALPEGRLAEVSVGLGRRIPMLGWFQSLMPKQGNFFAQFEAHAALLVEGADALARLVSGDGATATHVADIVRYEHAADDLTRDVLQDVRRVFVTPFDRSAIIGLIGSMDDAIDQMNGTAGAITLYGVADFDACMREMASIGAQAARIVAEAIPLLRGVNRNGDRLNDLTGQVIELEGRADRVHADGLKALYAARQGEPMQFIVRREIYSHLERIVDRFEDVANEIQGLVIDHA